MNCLLYTTGVLADKFGDVKIASYFYYVLYK